jgi:hypothetical protein
MTRLTPVAIGVIALSSSLLAASPSADYLYPSGPGAPINTKILVHVPCCGGVNTDPISVRAGAQAVAGRSEYFGFEWIVFTPAQLLLANTAYTVNVALPNRTSYAGGFTTGASADSAPPQLVSTTPANGQDTILINQPVRLRFSKPMNPLSLTKTPPTIVELQSGNSMYGITVGLADSSTFQLTGPLLPGAAYRVYFPGPLPEDLSGNVLSAPGADFVFTTYPEAPKDGAQLRKAIPADSDAAVPTNTAIFLMFDRPVVMPAEGGLSLSSASEPRVPLKVEAIDVLNVLIVRPQTLLRGNQQYTLRVEKLYDQYGVQYPTGPLIRFTTAALPELRAFTQVSGPRSTMPNVRRVRWRFSRPVNPYLLPRLASLSKDASYYPPTVDTRLLDDGVTIEADVDGPGDYVLAGYVYDRVECKTIGQFSPTFTVSPVREDRPPSAIANFPPDQATGVPPTVAPAIAFDASLDTLLPDQVLLWRGAERVSVDVTRLDRTFTLKPRQPLESGAEYRVEFRAPRDISGNTGPDVVWTFRVGAPPPADSFRVVQVEPANDSTSVAADSPIIVTFNRPPNPVSLLTSYCASVSSASGSLPGRWRVENNRAIFQADPRLAAGSRVVWSVCGVSDFTGQAVTPATSYGAFWTSASDEALPPLRVVAVAPAEGESSVAGDGAITLKFNQSAAGSTVTNRSVLLTTADGRFLDTMVYYDAALQQVRVSTDVGGLFTVVATSAIRSSLGASLEPFSATVRVRSQNRGYGLPSQAVPGPFIRSVIPSNHSSTAVDSPLVVYFNEPMDRGLVERGFRVAVGGSVVTGLIDWTPDSRALTFFPLAPLPATSSGYLVLSLVPWGRAGAESSFFTTGTTATSVNPNYRWNLMGRIATDSVIDIEFDSDRPNDFVRSAKATTGANNQTAVQLQISQKSRRIFRFRSPQPFKAGSAYAVEFQTAANEKGQAFFSVFNFATPESRQVTVGPTEAMGEAPVNSLIWLQSQTMLNRLSVNPTLTLNGEEVPFTTEFLDAGFLVLLHPRGLLRGNSVYNVTLAGLEDMAGRPIPDRAWSFRTGPGPDFTPTVVKSWTPTGTASTAAILHVTFNNPVFFLRQRLQDSEVANAYDFPLGGIQFSPDGRTLSYIPNRPWPIYSNIGVEISRFSHRDWTNSDITETRGGGYNLVTPGFYTGSIAGALPKVEALNPLPNAEGAPRNVQIQARFENGVLESSLAGIRLETDGSAVAARVVLASDGRTLSIFPTRLLDSLRRYTVILAGVQNTEGVTREDTELWSFTTSESVAGPPPAAIEVPAWADPFSILLLLPRPVNPLSVNTAVFDLSTREIRVAANVTIENGGTAIRVAPKVPAPPDTSWTLSVTGLTDWAGFSFGRTYLSISASDVGDRQPPSIQILLPASGTTVPWNTLAVAVFDKAVYLRGGDANVRLTFGGQPVPATVNQPSPNVLTMHPLLDWQLGATYQVELTGILDLKGNESPAISWSFAIAPDGIADPTGLRLTSSTPMQGAVGVAPDAPIVLEFSKPVFPVADYYSSALSLGSGFFRETWDRNRVRLEPFASLPAGRQISIQARVGDAAGNRISASLYFSTAALQDTDPPRVESISPTPGSRLVAGTNNFLIRFTKPVQLSGDWIRFSAGGQSATPQTTSFPAQGDGRTVVVSFNLPPDSRGTLDLRSGLTDLTGNGLAPVSFEYSTMSADESYSPKVSSMRPTDGSQNVQLDAAVELRFTQAMNEGSLTAALRVTNDGYQVPVTLTSDDGGRVWHAVSSTRWSANSMVLVEVADTAFSASGLQLNSKFAGQFRTGQGTATTSSNYDIAALEARRDAIDIRFAAPRLTLPDEPFGVRMGQVRIPFVVEQLGPAWFRLIPGTPLEPGVQYHLMAGPGIEFPLHTAREQAEKAVFKASSAPEARMDASGNVCLRFNDPVHAFSIDRGTFALLDQKGRPIPHEVRVESDRRTIVIDPFGPTPVWRIIWLGREIAISR